MSKADKIFCMPDHNTPTKNQEKPISDPVSKAQVDTLAKNAEEFGLNHFGMINKKMESYMLLDLKEV